ncbi:hypothetical protein D910_01845 [Dendroctonus ponderosae]|uniref:Uncharacterized protein n=1 Tax=Dendroctonus ponderosae TaxID=77166 RepID=U4TUH8_DENPD|nr:hypothetical protein D910_01845 [Dendroctonus ponderosae]
MISHKVINAEKQKTAHGLIVVKAPNQLPGLIDLLKSTKVDGLELNLKKLTSKNDISDFISTIKTKLGSDLDIALSVPSKPELVAKYFDFKALSKHAELFILETAFLGASTNITFHPSRLSGMWDMQNTGLKGLSPSAIIRARKINKRAIRKEMVSAIVNYQWAFPHGKDEL